MAFLPRDTTTHPSATGKTNIKDDKLDAMLKEAWIHQLYHVPQPVWGETISETRDPCVPWG